MLQTLKSILCADKESAKEKIPVPGKCLVDIRLAGRTHTFLQDMSFAEKLTETLPSGGFFGYPTTKGGYILNLDLADRLEFFEEVTWIEGGDPDGCSIWLKGGDKSIKLGAVDQTFEEVYRSVNDESFITIGRHAFNRNKIALIVFH